MTDAPCVCPACSRVFNWGDDADSAAVVAKGGQWISCAKNAYWKLTFHMRDVHPGSAMVCGRRGEGGPGPMSAYPQDDFWHVRDHHQVCSYCGSMHPDEFFKAIEDGCELGPTDKNYKVYVDLPNPDVGKVKEMGSSSGPSFLRDGSRALDDLTEAEIKAGRYNRPIMGKAAAHIQAKFYFQHLDEAAMRRFIDLLNAKKVNIGVPGYFYTRPFFVAPPAKAS